MNIKITKDTWGHIGPVEEELVIVAVLRNKNPTIETIAMKAGLSVVETRRIINSLTERGYLQKLGEKR